MEKTFSNAVVMQQMAKFLAPKDILSLRLVSSSIHCAVQSAFQKHVPIWLDDLDIRFFTAEEGPLEKRRMLNEKFYLKVRPNSRRRVQALLDLSLMFSCQIKTLHLWLDPLYDEIRDLMEILAPLSGTLRELTVTFVINNEEEIEDDIWLGINYPIMENLRKLEFLDETTDSDKSNVYSGEHCEKCLGPFPFFCPNLEELRFNNFPDLHQGFSEQLSKYPEKLSKLKSLELQCCTNKTMKCIAEASFAAKLQRLVLFPSCKEGMHTTRGRNDYGLSVTINNLLKAAAKQITVLDLRLKTVFSREFDEDGYDEWYVYPTLPQMLKLKTLVFFAVNAEDVCSHFDCDDKLEFVFEETQRGCNEVSRMAQLFPSLESLTVVEFVDRGRLYFMGFS